MLVLIWLILTLFAAPKPIWAQAPLKEVRDNYAASVNSYRAALNQFKVDLITFQQSPSNINQDILVLSTKKLLGAQAQAWIKYFKALALDGQETSGNNPEFADTKSILEQKQTELNDKAATINQITDKPAAEAAINEANNQNKDFQLLSTKTVALIKLYRTKYAIDQINQFKDKLAQLIPTQVVDSGKQESQLRAVAEAQRLLETSQTDFAAALDHYQKAPSGGGSYMLDRTNDDLKPIYANLDQAMRLLKEASKGIEI